MFSYRDVLGKERARGGRDTGGKKKRKHLWRKGQKDTRIEGGRGEKGKDGKREGGERERKVLNCFILLHFPIQSTMSLVETLNLTYGMQQKKKKEGAI